MDDFISILLHYFFELGKHYAPVYLCMSFLKARAEILKKIVGLLIDLKTPKGHFEINWPLEPFFYASEGPELFQTDSTVFLNYPLDHASTYDQFGTIQNLQMSPIA